MDDQVTNPILPAARVYRKHAEEMSAGGTTSELRQRGDGSPNPLGRVSSDDGTHTKTLLRCKKPFLMAIFNANRVREEGRLRKQAHCFCSNGISLLGVQEHSRVHDNPLVFTRVEGRHLITASA
ncbi:hypothetical protein CAPTEDRAFT_120632 [Capitella teleta]|uniref:Uncharacterized protein n=1 Tax=Capitella teleta TaxID=283909 RepID=R7T418_CAPTE|nr:hypothetical protein CAPTEDRAFT_120632 [Capitella teleta]|eukprot:ELT87558.1 hypothetical protein CAPTEDRAFT_120632 [Capitella teleta]